MFGNCGDVDWVTIVVVIIGVVVVAIMVEVVVEVVIITGVDVAKITGVVVATVVVETITGVVVATTTGVGVGITQTGLVIELESKVTAPFLASILPSTFAPVVIVADVSAIIFPLKIEFVPSVAELPTCQITLQACAPFRRTILLAPPVISVDADLKIKIALGLFCASRMRVPVIANEPSIES